MRQTLTKDLDTLAASLLAGVKLHARIDGTDSDTDITKKIKAAIAYCETYTGLDFTASSYKEIFPAFPHYHHNEHHHHKITLSRAPLKSITSLKYYDAANVEQTLSTSDYYLLNPSNQPAWLEPVNYFPATYPRPDAVSVEYTTGYTTLPPQFLHAVDLYVGAADQNRQAEITGTISKELEIGLHRLLDQLDTYTYA
jgi:uncharacterized phiE125 gp8 family phage protein